MKKHIVLLLLCPLFLVGQQSFEINLYSFETQVKHSDKEQGEVKLHAQLVAVADNAKPAILIFPGGGYTVHSFEYEGTDIADWYNERGTHAFVLAYRLGEFDGSGNRHPAMLNDAKRAMRTIRANAKKWGVDPNKIGVMGFSAGGHMAAMISTHFDDGNPAGKDSIEHFSSLPNFSVLAYPVITMNNEYTHWGSRRFLLGPTPSQADIDYISVQDHIKGQTPPTFLFHTSDDKAVPVQNSIQYYLALRELGIPAEMHIYEHGKHGVGMAANDDGLKSWMTLLENWLGRWGMID